MTTKHTTREEWLQAAIVALRPMFAALGHQIPEVRVSVGFPGGRNARKTVIGQCWNPAASADGVGQIFISPILGDVAEVLETLAHELVHAVNHANGESGHGKEFAAIAKPLGFLAPMTSTPANEVLKANLRAIAALLGEYPHAALTPELAGVKKQGTRQLLVVCAEADPLADPKTIYKVRMTRQWLDSVGSPICPCHGLEMREV